MKKTLLLFVSLFAIASAHAITSVDEICGSWKTSGTYQFDSNYTGTFEDKTIAEGICTITKTGDNTVSIQNLLGDDNKTMTGTVDVAAGTITVKSASDIWDYYTMCGSDGTSAPVLTVSADGKTISTTGATFTYYDSVFGKECNLTLTADGEPAAELLWSQDGYAWTPAGKNLGAVKLQAYSDGTYVVTDWMGTAGYNLKFKMVEDTKWTALMSIQNQYSTIGGYDYVNAGSLSMADPICYAGMYTASGYSGVYGIDNKRVTAPQWEGGYLSVYTYAYDSNEATVFSGYYSVTWGAEYSYTVNPFRSNYMEKAQSQVSHITKLTQDNFDATVKIYKDGTYLIKNWEGVEGYDLKFRLGNEDSLTVLNDNATEVVTAKGSRYWRVPTGRTDYDRACVYQNSSIYNTLDIHAERANIVFGCSFLYPTGSNSGDKAYYAVRGFNADSEKTVSMRECVWNNEAYAYVDTVNFNRANVDSVKVYTLTDVNDSTYYCVPDFIGKDVDGLGTGDLLFGLYGGMISNPQLLNLNSQENSGYTYYYYMFGNDSSHDCALLNYFYSSDADFANGGSLVFDVWYQPAGASSADGKYTYYCLNLDKADPTGIKGLNGSASTAKQTNGKYIQNGRLVIQNGDKKYTTTGVEVK